MSNQLSLFQPVTDQPLQATQTASGLERLNLAQRDAVEAPIDRGVQVLAGAGTGKTELIAYRVLAVMEKLISQAENVTEPFPEDSILVVTFTDKAARSMRQRIDQRVQERFGRPLSLNAPIGTFHQFCMKLLRTYALEAGLSPDFNLIRPIEQAELMEQLLLRIQQGVYSQIDELLQRYQLEAIPVDCLSPERLAELETASVSELLSDAHKVISRIKAAGLAPHEFAQLAKEQTLAFSNALRQLPVGYPLSNEPFDTMRDAIVSWQESLSPWSSPLWEPLALERLFSEEELTGSKYKDAVKCLMESKWYLQYNRSKKKYLPVAPHDFTALQRQTRLELQLIDVVASMYALYQDQLEQRQLCDFDDLINRAAWLLSDNPVFCERIRNQFEAIIVDEFQDSNGSQLRLLSQLLRTDKTNLTVVGDEKQSIYAFRFAQPENLNLVFDGRNHQAITLKTNYRCHREIIQHANALTKRLLGNDSQHLQPPDSAVNLTDTMNQSVQLCNVQEIYLQSLEPEDQPDEFNKPPGLGFLQQVEADWIAAEAERLHRGEQVTYLSMAVLVKNHRKAEVVYQALKAKGIPAYRQKPVGFFHEPVIKDALAAMQLIHRPSNELALGRILQSRLNQAQLRWLFNARQAQNLSLLQVMAHLETLDTHDKPPARLFSDEAIRAISTLAAEIEVLRKLRHRLTPQALFRQLVGPLGLLHPDDPQHLQTEARIALKAFDSLLEAVTLELPGYPDLKQVLDRLARYQASPDTDLPISLTPGTEDAVLISTVHGVKGLEFPVVFAACCDSSRTHSAGLGNLIFDPQFGEKAGFGLILGSMDGETTLKKQVYQMIWQKPRDEQERMRLHYVALTRAKERLYVLHAPQSAEWVKTEPDSD